MYDYLIVGTGIFGSTFAYEANKANKKVLVIEKRSHIGGNCYTENSHSIHVHKYGPHIFHTNSERIWNYVNQFSKFNNFCNRIKVNYQEKIYSFPINLLTLHQLWGVKTPEEAELKLKEVKIKIDNPKNMEEWILSNVGEEIYHKFFYGYTKKQWKKNPSELPSSIIKRIPIRMNYNDNYYNDKYQGVPINGYTEIFEKMLNGIEVKFNTELKDINWKSIAKKLVYSGKPEELLNYKYGELEYLTLNFEESILEKNDYQGNAIINYTDEKIAHTRIIEHKHFYEENNSGKTIITKETPVEWTKNSTPYYPINTKENNELYQKYKSEISNDIILGGRLGRYQYMDMDQVFANAISEFEKIY